jgi:hypothetical protein
LDFNQFSLKIKKWEWKIKNCRLFNKTFKGKELTSKGIDRIEAAPLWWWPKN